MQRPVDVEVNLAAFVPEVAGGAVLALMQVRQSRKFWVLGLCSACCRPRVHGGRFIEMGWRFHPGETKVVTTLHEQTRVAAGRFPAPRARGHREPIASSPRRAAAQARLEALLDTHREEGLTAEETAELEVYAQVNHLLLLLKARARLATTAPQ